MAVIFGTTDLDNLPGTSVNDTLFGWALGGNANSVSGNDTLNGGGGNDSCLVGRATIACLAAQVTIP